MNRLTDKLFNDLAAQRDALAAENARQLETINGHVAGAVRDLTRIAALESIIDRAYHELACEDVDPEDSRLATLLILSSNSRPTPATAETNRNQAGPTPSDAGVVGPTPRGSLPNSLGASLETGPSGMEIAQREADEAAGDNDPRDRVIGVTAEKEPI